MTIIQAKSDYLSKIYQLILQFAESEGILDKVLITEPQLGELLFCANPNHFVGLAKVKDQVVGYALFNFITHNVCFNVKPGTYIEHLFVLPEFRGQGFGLLLLQFVAEKAKEADCSRIELWVSQYNQSANNFYKKLSAIDLSDWNILKWDENGINQLLKTGGPV